ncbi:MAG TPA: hypothetical protein VL426_06805 [Candidatus Binatia bacterium]|nr:hypothetical protein [Candidatus Binatia bacterium]
MEASDLTNASAAMSPATADELRMLVYHPRHASDPDRPLRFARQLLGRPALTHAALPSLPATEADRLIAALKAEFPDRTASITDKVRKELLGRLD